MSRSEAILQEQVESLARLRRWRLYHTFDSRRSEPGFPDLVLVRGDRLLFRELKSNTGKPTVEQEAWLMALMEAGQDVGVWRPTDWLQIEMELE